MRSSFVVLPIALVTLGARPLAAQELDNVAAFARLYGVVRWFYPGDSAAALDWNRFAVHGVSRVRAARTPKELETTLDELFTPLGPGIEIGAALSPNPKRGNADASLIAWRHYGAGLGLGPSRGGAYRSNSAAIRRTSGSRFCRIS